MSNLIGRGADQIPVNGMLGKLAFMDVARGAVWLGAVGGSGAVVDVDSYIGSAYREYLITSDDVVTSINGGQLLAQMKISGAYVTTGTYGYATKTWKSNGTEGLPSAPGNASNFRVIDNIGNAVGKCGWFALKLVRPDGPNAKAVQYTFGSFTNNSNEIECGEGVAFNSGTGPLTGIRFMAESGTFSSTFHVFGVG